MLSTCEEEPLCCSFGSEHEFPRSSPFSGPCAAGAANEQYEVEPRAQSAAHNITAEQVWAQSQDSDKVPGCHGPPCAGGLPVISLRPSMLIDMVTLGAWSEAHLGRIQIKAGYFNSAIITAQSLASNDHQHKVAAPISVIF